MAIRSGFVGLCPAAALLPVGPVGVQRPLCNPTRAPLLPAGQMCPWPIEGDAEVRVWTGSVCLGARRRTVVNTVRSYNKLLRRSAQMVVFRDHTEPVTQKTEGSEASEDTMEGAGNFDIRLIDTFDGTGDVVEWHTQASLLCEYRGVPLVDVLPMRLKGGAFAVWSQLSSADRRSADAVKSARQPPPAAERPPW